MKERREEPLQESGTKDLRKGYAMLRELMME